MSIVLRWRRARRREKTAGLNSEVIDEMSFAIDTFYMLDRRRIHAGEMKCY